MVHNESKGKNFKKMLVAEQTMIIVEDSGETFWFKTSFYFDL